MLPDQAASRPTRSLSVTSSTTSIGFKLGRMPLQLVIALDDAGSGDGLLYRVFDDGVTPVAVVGPGLIECSPRFFLNEEERATLLRLFTSALGRLLAAP